MPAVEVRSVSMTAAAEGVELPQLSEVTASRERSSTTDRGIRAFGFHG